MNCSQSSLFSNLSLEELIEQEIDIANMQIEELELTTNVVAPESTLSDIISFENISEEELNQRNLKKIYMRKRKLLYFKDRLQNDISFSCSVCLKEIDLERLLIMPKARLCKSCINGLH
jgi:RNA polymerase-binding transcription factor DksA